MSTYNSPVTSSQDEFFLTDVHIFFSLVALQTIHNFIYLLKFLSNCNNKILFATNWSWNLLLLARKLKLLFKKASINGKLIGWNKLFIRCKKFPIINNRFVLN